MLRRLRSTWLAGGGAFLLVVSLSGIASAAPLVTDTQTFVDMDGNGVADSCQAAVLADPVAGAASFAAADTDADGTISVTEAAHSGWIGGANCNHGGYVSSVANAAGDTAETCDTGTPPAADGDTDDGSADGDTDEDGDAPAVVATTVSTVAPAADCTEDPADPTEDAPVTEAPPAVCLVVTTVAPVVDAPVDAAPNAHGKAVSLVAQSDAVGGKNCNHGGAVSAAAKKDHGADAAAKAAKHAKHAHGKGHKTN
jgi:hypothetical protein